MEELNRNSDMAEENVSELEDRTKYITQNAGQGNETGKTRDKK